MADDIFDINLQWKAYLRRGGIADERTMPPIQVQETKRAFYAGFGALMVLIRTDMRKLSEEEFSRIMDGYMEQVSVFFIQESNKDKRKKGVDNIN